MEKSSMGQKTGSYQIIDFPAERRAMPAYLELKSGRHVMYALLDVDVTVSRRFIEDYKAKTGEQLSFTGYMALCLARAVDENKTVQAYKKGSKQIIVFDDVDVGIMIERKQGETPVLTGYVIRAANRKTVWEIHQEIRSAQSEPVPPNNGMPAWFRSALLLPWPLSALFKVLFRMIMLRNPTIVTSVGGTVGISSVGMFGKGHAGWGIASGSHVLDLIVGGTARRLVEVEERIETREMLSLTIIFDHDVIDGAPAARFTRKLVELIESGFGLDLDKTRTEDESTPAGTQTA
jgi:pyruvate/2-oxoglutarate dehydrogenase complex dihydrolipoamide acyltransferase (E2) component